MTKLTVEQVVEIKQMIPFIKCSEIAPKYYVTTGTISAIKSGKSWKYV